MTKGGWMETPAHRVSADPAAFAEEFERLFKARGLSWKKLSVVAHVSTSLISEWRRGSRLADAETLQRVTDALRLTGAQAHYLKGLAGHLTYTQMPPRRELLFHLRQYVAYISNFDFPAYIDDYRFRYYACNVSTVSLVGGARERLKELARGGVTVWDVCFNRSLGILDRLINTDNLQRDQILWFMQRNIMRQHERWYRTYPDAMRERLIDHDDYATFCRLWQEVAIRLAEPEPLRAYSDPIPSRLSPLVVLRRFPGDDEPLVFRILELRAPFAGGFAGTDLFTVVRYEPAPDLERFFFSPNPPAADPIERYRAHMRGTIATVADRTPICLWDDDVAGVTGLDALIEEYNEG